MVSYVYTGCYLFHTLLQLSQTTHLKPGEWISLSKSYSLPGKCTVKGSYLPRSFPPAWKSHTCSHWIFHEGHCHCNSPILNPFSVFMSYLLTMPSLLKQTFPRHAHFSACTHTHAYIQLPWCIISHLSTASKIESVLFIDKSVFVSFIIFFFLTTSSSRQLQYVLWTLSTKMVSDY